jgi:hypothetical protein
VVEVLFRQGRLPLSRIFRHARLPEKSVSEALIVLVKHGLIRWLQVEEGPLEITFYECLFEDIYPLIRFGKEIQMAEKHNGPEVYPHGRLVRFTDGKGWESNSIPLDAGGTKDQRYHGSNNRSRRHRL